MDLPDAVSALRPVLPWVFAILLVIAAIVATIFGHDLAVPLLNAAARAPTECACADLPAAATSPVLIEAPDDVAPEAVDLAAPQE